MSRRSTRAVVFVLAIAAPFGIAAAQKKGKYSHPNLAAADRLCMQAITKLEAAQVANEFDLGGHAKKAKELLAQAQEQIRLATRAASKR